jgi:hypothetical protein
VCRQRLGDIGRGGRASSEILLEAGEDRDEAAKLRPLFAVQCPLRRLELGYAGDSEALDRARMDLRACAA